MKRQLLTVAFLTACSQCAAFFKLWFVARLFGIGSEMDGYNLALVAPTLVAGILSALIQTGIFPVRSAYKVAASAAPIAQFDRSVFWTCVSIGAVASLVVFLAAGDLADLLVDRAALAETHAVVATLLPILACLVVLNVSTDTMGYLLAMNDRFAYAAGAPILNGLIGAIILALWPEHGLQSLVVGTILGLIGQLLVCLVGLKSFGFVFLGPLQSQTEFLPLGRQMVSLSVWIFPGVIVSNFTASLPMIWAAQFGEGAASTFGYAYRLHTSVVQLLVMASSTVILAHFSMLLAKGDNAAVKRILVNGAFLSFGLGGVAMVGVIMLGQPLLEGIFAGRFDAEAADRVSAMWAWLTAGLSFTLLGNIFAKLWQAQGRTKLMSVMALITMAVLGATFFATKQYFDEISVALAICAASASAVLLGVPFVRAARASKEI